MLTALGAKHRRLLRCEICWGAFGWLEDRASSHLRNFLSSYDSMDLSLLESKHITPQSNNSGDYDENGEVAREKVKFGLWIAVISWHIKSDFPLRGREKLSVNRIFVLTLSQCLLFFKIVSERVSSETVCSARDFPTSLSFSFSYGATQI